MQQALQLFESRPNARIAWLRVASKSGWLTYADALARWQLFAGTNNPAPAEAAAG